MLGTLLHEELLLLLEPEPEQELLSPGCPPPWSSGSWAWLWVLLPPPHNQGEEEPRLVEDDLGDGAIEDLEPESNQSWSQGDGGRGWEAKGATELAREANECESTSRQCWPGGNVC